MSFSYFIQLIYNYYGSNISSGAKFVSLLFSAITNNEISLLDGSGHPTSLAEKLFNGNASISVNIRKRFNANYDEEGLIHFLEECNLTDDAKDNLLKELKNVGLLESYSTLVLEKIVSKNLYLIINTRSNKNLNSNQDIDETFINSKNNFIITQFNDNDITIPVSNFKGRERELEELRSFVKNQEKLIIISGMGGIGKTEICRKLYITFLNEWKNNRKLSIQKMGFIPYVDNLDNSLIRSLEFNRSNNYEEDLHRAWNTLRNYANKYNILLFIDNVTKSMEQDTSLNKLLNIHGSIIMTSRKSNYERFKKYYIDCMQYYDCKELFIDILRRNGVEYNVQDETDLSYIIKNLACSHTKTIELLANLVVKKSWGIHRLKLELVNKKFDISLNAGEDLLVDELSKIFDLSDISNYSEINILEAFSILPYMFIENEKCLFFFSKDANLTQNDEILNRLYQLGWWLERENANYRMHPVLAEVIKNIQQPSYNDHQNLINSVIQLMNVEQHELKEILIYKEYAMSLANYFKDNMEYKIEEALSKVEHYLANYDKALEYQKYIIDKKIKIFFEDSLEMAKTYNEIGYIYVDKGNPKEALEWYFRAFSILENYEKVSKFTAILFTNIAVAYYDRKEYNDAYIWHCKALTIKKQLFGKRDISVANTYNHIANIFADTGKTYKALNLYKKVLRYQREKLPYTHHDIATTLNNIGTVYRDLGEYENALEWIEKAIVIYIKIYGDEHPYTARLYHNLGTIYDGLTEFNEAKKYYVKAYIIRTEKLGKDKSTTKSTKNKLKHLYKKLNVNKSFIEWINE